MHPALPWENTDKLDRLGYSSTYEAVDACVPPPFKGAMPPRPGVGFVPLDQLCGSASLGISIGSCHELRSTMTGSTISATAMLVSVVSLPFPFCS